MSEREKQIKAVQRWWNIERNKNKWNKAYEDDNLIHTLMYLKTRQAKVLDYLDNLNLTKDAKILELGYGAGQTILELVKRDFNVYGLDISKNFCDSAIKRCNENYPQGKFDIKVGNVEGELEFDNNTFDVVIIIGTLQYLFNPSFTIQEAYRVLKPGGHIIIAQRNIYSLSNFTSIRDFLRSCVHFFLREQYELQVSFKSLLTESRLGIWWFKNADHKMFNTKFMLKHHVNLKYNIKKRKFSYFSLKKLLKNNLFNLVNKDGAYYCFSENQKMYSFNLKCDRFLKWLRDHLKIPYLYTLARSIIVIAQKKPN